MEIFTKVQKGSGVVGLDNEEKERMMTTDGILSKCYTFTLSASEALGVLAYSLE